MSEVILLPRGTAAHDLTAALDLRGGQCSVGQTAKCLGTSRGRPHPSRCVVAYYALRRGLLWMSFLQRSLPYLCRAVHVEPSRAGVRAGAGDV